jgi:ferric-dicitrate binding protein FerR (iron transport regulator)
LAEVVECFNRHGVVRFELADPTIGALQLSGVLRPDSPHALLHILRTDFDLRDQRRADGTIVLNKR